MMRVERQSRQFECDICKQVFSRLEHLTRHSRSHEAERSFRCKICLKGFYRTDALKRHERIHNGSPSDRLSKGNRACQACAVGRRKCSGGQNCEACQKRGIPCIRTEDNEFSPSLDKARRSSDAVSEDLTPSEIEILTGPSPNRHTLSYGANQFPVETDLQPGSEHEQLHHSPGVFHQHLTYSEPGRPRISHVKAQQSLFLDRTAWVNTQVPDAWLQSNMSTMNWVFDHQIPESESHGSLAIRSPHGNAEQSPPPSWQAVNTRTVAMDTNSHLPTSLLASSPGSQSTLATSGRYYVDGDGARLPHVKRRCLENEMSPHKADETRLRQSDEVHSKTFSLPDLSLNPTRTTSHLRIGEIIYAKITDSFERLCIASSTFPPYENSSVPNEQLLSSLIQFYFDFFQPIMPFIHQPTFELSQTHWLLVLAIAAIGSHYLNPVSRDFIAAMHEFVRRNLVYSVSLRPTTHLTTKEIQSETSGVTDLEDITMTQVRLLNAIGMQYCGTMRACKSLMHSLELATFCNTAWSLGDEALPINTKDDTLAPSDWTSWHKAESRRRTGYCIWLLDCMSVFYFQRRPLLSLDKATVPLPCQEVLWEADSLMDWHQLFSCATPSPPLEMALEHLYIDKRLQPSMGEFSRIILIHALFHRTWEVGRYLKQPLSSWTPTAERQDSSIFLKSSQTELYRNSTFAKWRNSACDCLDILHWHANSVIGAAAGMEHPTVLHLHLARVVLLAPTHDISALVERLVDETSSKSAVDAARKSVRRWAIEDHYKARLAMIHAGVTFWHVRRYSADGFYEPWAVYLATIALWAYSSFAKHPLSKTMDDNAIEDNGEDELFQATIQLDRPADDELVQLFVKGSTMKANVTGVGNIHDPRGPERIIREGIKLLVGLAHWDLDHSRADVLTKLKRMTDQGSAV